jgi:hypothetical protein
MKLLSHLAFPSLLLLVAACSTENNDYGACTNALAKKISDNPVGVFVSHRNKKYRLTIYSNETYQLCERDQCIQSSYEVTYYPSPLDQKFRSGIRFRNIAKTEFGLDFLRWYYPYADDDFVASGAILQLYAIRLCDHGTLCSVSSRDPKRDDNGLMLVQSFLDNTDVSPGSFCKPHPILE